MSYTLTRTWYCQHCKEAGRPDKGNYLLLKGHTTGKVKIYKIVDSQPIRNRGFTPHIIMLEKVFRGQRKVQILVACAMVTCGVWVTNPDENGDYQIGFTKVKRFVMSLNDWIALKGFKRTSFYI